MDMKTFIERKADLAKFGNEPFPWVLKGQDLLSSAAQLAYIDPDRKYLGKDNETWARESGTIAHRSCRAITMLQGMSAECFLKALWLQCGEELFKDGRYRGIPNSNDHHLDSIAVILSKRYGFTFTDSEIKMLYGMSEAIVSGRYPVRRTVAGRNPVTADGRVLKDTSELYYYPDEDVIDMFNHLWYLLSN